MKPTIGRIVHYVVDEELAERFPANAVNAAVKGETFPAMVVRVFEGSDPLLCNLKVFVDTTIGYVSVDLNVYSREEGDRPGTWHWPPRA